jgi:hypothetical protein
MRMTGEAALRVRRWLTTLGAADRLRFWEGHGEFAAGVYIAEEHVGYGVSAFAARVPGFGHCGYLVEPGHGDWLCRFRGLRWF